jgi:hypothetical protein
MWYSSRLSSVMTGPSRPSSCEGNSEALFWMNRFSKEAWKVGNTLGELGRSRLYEEVSGKAAVTEKGPFH